MICCAKMYSTAANFLFLLTSCSTTRELYPQPTTCEVFFPPPQDILWFYKKKMCFFAMPALLQGLVGECGEVWFTCRDFAGCEWRSGSSDKGTPFELICTLWRLVKRDIWKTADRCDKGEYDSSLPSVPPSP